MTFFFSGGGSGGHAVCAHSIISHIQIHLPTVKIRYIGSRKSIEKQLALEKQIPYKAIFTGKFRRSLSIENISDFFAFLLGVMQSFFYFYQNADRKDILIATGGYVALPAVIAAKLRGMKICLHEQTSRVGLANQLAGLLAKQIMISFEASRAYFPKAKTIFTGYPLRKEFFEARAKEVKLMGIDLLKIKKKIILVTGGGNGSKFLNDLVDGFPVSLKRKYLILHQVGKAFMATYSSKRRKHYLPFAFVDNLPDIYPLAELVICRAGAGTVFELMALNKKAIFIPLKIARKNEQWHNAQEAKKHIPCRVFSEDNLDKAELIKEIKRLMGKKSLRKKQGQVNPVENIFSVLKTFVKK